MEALEILAYFIGAAALIVAFGFFFKCVDGGGARAPKGRIDTLPPNGLYVPDRHFREPQTWTYKTKTTTYVPREVKPKMGTKGAQPKTTPTQKPRPNVTEKETT